MTFTMESLTSTDATNKESGSSTRISTDTKGRKSSLRAERSKQSARECRVRKKLRYQCLEETVVCREKAVISLRNELSQLKKWSIAMDSGTIPAPALQYLMEIQQKFLDLNQWPLQTDESLATVPTTCDTLTILKTEEQSTEDGLISHGDNELETIEFNIEGFSDEDYIQNGGVSTSQDVLGNCFTSTSFAVKNELENTFWVHPDDYCLSPDTSSPANLIPDFDQLLD